MEEISGGETALTMIATVTLNPAVDLTALVSHFTLDTVNRGDAMRFDPGGKGVNVASFLADYGCATAVTGFLGRDNADIFERLFAQKRILDRFVRVAGQNRISIKIVDPASQTTTDLNMPGLSPCAGDVAGLFAALEQMASTGEFGWFALSGRLPQGLADDFYARLIERLKQAGLRTALDTSQAALRCGVAVGPTLVKPNIDELQQLVGKELDGEEAVERAARSLPERGVRWVAVSMGQRGALLVERDGAWLAQPPAVEVASTVGAGDAMVAGLIAGFEEGLGPADALRLATAFSVGAITRLGAHLPPRDELQGYARQVVVRRVR